MHVTLPAGETDRWVGAECSAEELLQEALPAAVATAQQAASAASDDGGS